MHLSQLVGSSRAHPISVLVTFTNAQPVKLHTMIENVVLVVRVAKGIDNAVQAENLLLVHLILAIDISYRGYVDQEMLAIAQA